MKNTILIVIVLVVVIGGLFLLNKAGQINISLSEQNESGESGTATLTEVDGKVIVSLDLNGAPDSVQPAHIHTGSCDNLGGVQNPLTSPVGGASETTLDVTMDDLLSGLPLAINVHKSPEEAGIYVACGDITQ